MDVRTIRDERPGGTVVGERTHQAFWPLGSGFYGPILQRGKLRPTAAHPCHAGEGGMIRGHVLLGGKSL